MIPRDRERPAIRPLAELTSSAVPWPCPAQVSGMGKQSQPHFGIRVALDVWSMGNSRLSRTRPLVRLAQYDRGPAELGFDSSVKVDR